MKQLNEIKIVNKNNDEKIKGQQFGSFAYHADRNGKNTQEDSLAFSEFDSEFLNKLSPKQIGDRLWTTHRNFDNDEDVKNAVGSLKMQGAVGTTASTTVYDGKDSLVTATLGDAVSFAAVYDTENNIIGVVRLNSLIHSPSEPSEKERIQFAGGSVINGRVNGSLAVSRAIGDHYLKHTENNDNLLVSSESQIDIHSIDGILKSLNIENKEIGKIQIISASDGLTDGMYSTKKVKNEQAMKIWIEQEEDYQNKSELELANVLVNKAIEQDNLSLPKRDNISVAINTITFTDNKPNSTPFLIGVYDGHGGTQVSNHVAENITNNFKNQCQLGNEEYEKQEFTQDKYLENQKRIEPENQKQIEPENQKQIEPEKQKQQVVENLKKLTNECIQNVGMFRDAYKVLKDLKNILDHQDEDSNSKIESFFDWLENTTDGKKNFDIIKDDNSRATGKFIAGILSIIAVIATLPIGLAVMVGVHAYRSHQGKNETLPHHLFKPHKKGEDFSNKISELNPEKNNLNK